MNTIINRTKLATTNIAKRILPKPIAKRVIPHGADTKSRINDLLYNPTEEATDWEMLTIVIRKDKAHHFDFLKASTQFGTVGKWHDQTEQNVEIQIQYKDTPDERVGTELMQLLKDYNTTVVKEEQAYARTEPVEETTL
jgi:hypothetical protein